MTEGRHFPLRTRHPRQARPVPPEGPHAAPSGGRKVGSVEGIQSVLPQETRADQEAVIGRGWHAEVSRGCS
jgi:hypothetical protein